jgi:hypothetical protein
MKAKFNSLKARQFFSKTIWSLGTKAFLIILLFVLLDLIFGAFIFYKYVYLAEIKQGEVSNEVLKFDKERYQKFVDKMKLSEGVK